MRQLRLPLAALILSCLLSTTALATAEFVYHEQTNNFVAAQTCTSGGADTTAGRYVANTDRGPAPGFQVFFHETYALRFKVEYQFFTNQARVYYTTDGSNPSGSFGTPFGTTRVAVAVYVAVYSDQRQGCQVVDILAASIPPQPAGTTVRYVVGAWPSGGPVNTSTLGMKTFNVTATDTAGNTTSRTIFYHVSYAVALLYDSNAGHGAGAQIRLKVQLRDGNGVNHSSPSVAVTALRITPRGNPAVTVREESGSFIFDPTLSYQGSPPGGYLYRFKADGLPSGEYDLVFMIQGDGLLHHAAPFRIN